MDKLAQIDIGEKFGSPFGLDPANDGKGLGDLISLLISNALVVSGLIALVAFIIGGFNMISGSGQGNKEKTAKGQQAATWGAIGFVVVFASYWIIKLIEGLTGTTFLTNPGIDF